MEKVRELINQEEDQLEMARRLFKGKEYDTGNIPGVKLAQIGREALDMEIDKEIDKAIKRRMQESGVLYDSDSNKGAVISGTKFRRSEFYGDLTDMSWLDERIREICDRGRI